MKYIKWICIICSKTFYAHPKGIKSKHQCKRCGNFNSIAIAKPKEENK